MKYPIGAVFQKTIDSNPPDWRIAPYRYQIIKFHPQNVSYFLRNIVTHREYWEAENVLDQNYTLIKKSTQP